MDLEQRVRDSRDEDAQIWAALLSAGLVEGRHLTIDSFFAAETEATARSLADALAEQGATTAAEPFTERAGLFRKVTRWSVQSTTTLPGATLGTVQAHTERMIRAGVAAGVAYDGWGAQVPEG